MKVEVHIEEQSTALAIERPQRGGPASEKGGPQAQGGAEGKGHGVHEPDLPDEFENLESAQDFYERLQPHLAKFARLR